MDEIAVCGAGIGGLAAAIALASLGLSVTVYERSAVLSEIGAGLQLSPNACAALRSLGVLGEVEVEAVRLEALRIGRGRDGAPLAELPLGDTVLRRFGAPFLVTQRADLHQVLRRRAEAMPTVRLVIGARLRGWTVTPDGVRLDFEDVNARPPQVRALVGADGLHSVVRAHLASAADAARVRGTAWRTTIDASTLDPSFRRPASNLWLGRGAHVVHYPVAAGRLVNVVAALDGDAPTGAAGDGSVIAARFADWASPVRRLIGAGRPWGTWPLVDRAPLATWSVGAVTLIGDAAHPMLPFLAQGAAQALEDAVALGQAVAAMPGDWAGAFRRFETGRRPRATRVQAESRRQAAIYHLGAPASAIRDVVLRATPAKSLLSRYDWLYGHTAPQDGFHADRCRIAAWNTPSAAPKEW